MTDLRTQLEAALNGSYTLEQELGRGGMATVYLAHDQKHDRPVALKVLHPELAASLGPERFQREIRLAARMQHPHILTVLDSGEAAGQLWFTMPYVEGETLRDRLRRERQLPIADALQIAREAARALDYAHQHGIVHRDIKPENILLTKDGSTLVADFGIARALEGDEPLTQTGVAVGTPAYMSPEQATGDPGLDARTDVYALGAVLYELLAGEPPFTGPTAQVVVMRRLTETPRPLRELRDTVPAAVDQAVQHALAKAPADRFATAGEFAQALQPSTTATAFRPPVRARPRVPTAVIALGLGFALGLGVLFAWRHARAADEAEPTGPKRIAVLPFENLGDSADAYFADGVTDAVRGKLMVLPGLEVIASNSSNEYRHMPKPPQEIARELGVDYLLVGKVRFAKAKDGTSRVQVSPELIQGSTAAGKWQEPFDAALTDVFQVQADIAGRVASALNVALGASQKQTLTERPTQNLAAYDAYLKGDAAQGLVVGDPPTLRSSITYYEKAVALDPSFADAWSKLARARAEYYFYITPNPGDAEAARNAAERAMALAPSRPEGSLAKGLYLFHVRADNAGALAAFEAGLKLSPDNAELLTLAALAEQSLGRWDAALAHLKRAAELDPRSATTQRRLAHAYLRLRRYPEGLAAANRGLTLAPTNLDLIENQAMIQLAQGDLEAARRVIRAVPDEVEPTALVGFFGWYWDLMWVLDDAQQQLLLRLPLDAFGGDRGTMAMARAQTYYLHGDKVKTRIYADSARLGYEETLEAAPNDPQRHVFLGLALAYLGRKADAIREGQRALALLPAGGDGYIGPYMQHQVARIYILTGEPDKAIDQLEALLAQPYFLSPAWLRIDPNFAPLKGNPRFEKLVAGG